VNDTQVLLSPWKPGSQIKTNSELENVKLEKCCNTETMKLYRRQVWSSTLREMKSGEQK